MSEAHTRRWNIEPTDFGMRICRGDHDKSEPCEWEFLYWADLYLRLQAKLDAVKEQLSLMPQSGSGYDYWIRQLRQAIGDQDE